MVDWAGATTRPAGYPSGGVPPATERSLHFTAHSANRAASRVGSGTPRPKLSGGSPHACVAVMVETLDRNFESVCELDLIFHSPKVSTACTAQVVDFNPCLPLTFLARPPASPGAHYPGRDCDGRHGAGDQLPRGAALGGRNYQVRPDPPLQPAWSPPTPRSVSHCEPPHPPGGAC